jgi:16S rRNA (adenine1518-N6/adenine1519-N6)-dimethyltransferase
MVLAKKPFPKKSLSQNYLTDDNICRKIVNSLDIKDKDLIIEIGAGQGALTRYILQKTSNFIAIELDKDNCIHLQKSLPDLKLINADFLNIDIVKSVKRYFRHKYSNENEIRIRVIGNIPYNITSDILFKLFDYRRYIDDALLMIQEEVAQRLTAAPNSKSYGITSVFTQVFTLPKLLFKVSRNCFFPKPGVDSRIIQLSFNSVLENKIDDINIFKRVVKMSFSSRRKTLKNCLSKNGFRLNDIDFDFSRRAETLKVEEFIFLSNQFLKLK